MLNIVGKKELTICNVFFFCIVWMQRLAVILLVCTSCYSDVLKEQLAMLEEYDLLMQQQVRDITQTFAGKFPFPVFTQPGLGRIDFINGDYFAGKMSNVVSPILTCSRPSCDGTPCWFIVSHLGALQSVYVDVFNSTGAQFCGDVYNGHSNFANAVKMANQKLHAKLNEIFIHCTRVDHCYHPQMQEEQKFMNGLQFLVAYLLFMVAYFVYFLCNEQ